MPVTYDNVAREIRRAGLDPRGGFLVLPEDRVPALADGRPAATLVLAGNLGGGFWPAFEGAPERRLAVDRLDAWTRRVLGEAAARLGAAAVFAFEGPPYHPFQRWGMRAEPLARSPLGLLIHPEYGLWHAYRGALLLAEAIDVPAIERRPSPCESCEARPCLSTCPVGAFTAKGYDAGACAAHVSSAGEECRDQGCLARRACPVGADHAYGAEQQRLHMRAFIAARQERA
jgi:ferredoxin